MTYNAPGPRTFREKAGDLDTKICGQLALIDAEIDTVKSTASSLASTVGGHTTSIGTLTSTVSGHTTSIGTLTTAVAGRVKYVSADLAPGNADAFCLALANPEAGSIIIEKIIVNVTTPGGTENSEINFGTAANGTTGSDNLIDGANANATAIYDNYTDKGTNGKTCAVLAAGQYITGQIKTANAAALAGKAYIFYVGA